jgi:hypothetical protein
MLETIKQDLYHNPSKSLLIAAKYVHDTLGTKRPTWLAVLSGGNPNFWQSACDEARLTCDQDEKPEEAPDASES